jgi:uncharacterized protein YbjT (DUF2867 family)|tara:strand:- start:5316 stop:6227 length:912 start_codon:yes stop_codon:yes gene_type:complete
MSLLIIGGTGTLGRQIVRQCLLNGLKTKCLVRNVRKATFLKEWGAELIYGDLNYPDSLVTALLDVNIIIDASTARLSDSSSVIDIDWVGKSCLIDLAASINVQKYICFSNLNQNNIKSQFDQFLLTSTLSYTVFYIPGFFQGLINQYAVPILERQNIVIDRPSEKVSYIDSQDVARLVLENLNNSELARSSVLLEGQNSFSTLDVIKLCEDFSGQKAKSIFLPAFFLSLSNTITKYFQFTWNISDRLAFSNSSLNKSFKCSISNSDLSSGSLENYLKDYFSKILVKLKEINYEDDLKRKDLTF